MRWLETCEEGTKSSQVSWLFEEIRKVSKAKKGHREPRRGTPWLAGDEAGSAA